MAAVFRTSESGPTQIVGRPGWFLGIAVIAVSFGCDASNQTRSDDQLGWEVVARVELEEVPKDFLGEVAGFAEAANGDLLVTDPLTHRVLRYSQDGRLLAWFGSYGSGPGEFRSPAGVVERSDGRILLVDPPLGRTTVLTAQLQVDTSFVSIPRPRGRVARLGEGLIFTVATADRATGVLHSVHGESRWTVPAPSPGSPTEYPYWGSVGQVHLAASSDLAVVGYSLLYPLEIRDSMGVMIDSIPAPPSYRPPSVPKIGAFAGPGAGERLERWLESFDVVAALTTVQDRFLVVARGRLQSGPSNRFETVHDRIDLYDLTSRRMVVGNAALPAGAEVLGGGRFLYLLVDGPPSPWTILRVALLEGVSSRSWQPAGEP